MPASYIRARTGIVANDTGYPSGSAQAGSIANPSPPSSPGTRTHVLVDVTGGGAGTVVRVTILGFKAETGNWYTVARLNAGADITPTTSTPVGNGNVINYAEVLSNLAAYDRWFPMITSIAGAGASVAVGFLVDTKS